MDLTFLLLFICCLIVACTIFPDQIKEGISRLFSHVLAWVEQGAEEQPTATQFLWTIFLAICFALAIMGAFMLLRSVLPFVFPSPPPHLAISLVCLASSTAIAVHMAKGPMRYVALVLAVLIPISFSSLAFLQMSMFLEARGETGPQPMVAALLLLIISAAEIVCVYCLLSTGNALGYIWWLGLMSPLWLVYFLAWLLGLLRGIPDRMVSWVTALKGHKMEKRMELAPIRKQAIQVNIQETEWALDEELQTRNLNNLRYYVRRESTHIRRYYRRLLRMTSVSYTWQCMRHAPENARLFYRKVQTTVQETVDLSIDFMRSRHRSKIAPNHAADNGQVAHETAEKIEENLKRLMIILLAIGTLAWGTAQADTRTISIYMDVTGSYPYLAESVAHVHQNVVPYFGPNDIVIISKIGNFQNKVSLQMRFPLIDPNILDKTQPSLFHWRDDNAVLEMAWHQSDSLKTGIATYLEHELVAQDGGVTALHQYLSYVSIQLNQIESSDKWLLLYSDLLEETGGERTQLPPNAIYSFEGVHVRFLFCPYEQMDRWIKIRDAWTEYFQKAHAASFKIFDVASSTMIDPLPSNPIPEKLPPFGTH